MHLLVHPPPKHKLLTLNRLFPLFTDGNGKNMAVALGPGNRSCRLRTDGG